MTSDLSACLIEKHCHGLEFYWESENWCAGQSEIFTQSQKVLEGLLEGVCTLYEEMTYTHQMIRTLLAVFVLTVFSASAYAEMFQERTGIEINQIVILVVTEDGLVQEFVKDKNDYLQDLVDTIDQFTEEWVKENEESNAISSTSATV